MKFPRTSGILLHPTSLPSEYGIGDLGSSAYRFVDFLADSGMHLWQLLPLTPTGYGDSPYQCFSAFAGNTMLISPEKLVEDGFLDVADLEPVPRFSSDKVDFAKIIPYKSRLLRLAYERFVYSTDTGLRSDFLSFCNDCQPWLDDYALFRVLKDKHDGAAWHTWDRPFAQREPAVIESAYASMSDGVEAEKFYQYLFFKQWNALRDYCHEKQVSIIGDLPIFVAYDSADVWVNPEYFKLNEAGAPLVVAGVPPDYFSATGQLWGNPIYNWATMKEDGFKWWIRRIEAMLKVIDIIRIDHFRGFAACWEIPAGDTTAERGRWVDVPGRELFSALLEGLGDLPIIVEDLGVITPDVEALRDDFGFPGMRVLQMAFSTDATNIDLPHNHLANAVVYTGTHDNDTAIGWFNSKAGAGSTRDASQIRKERAMCKRYLRVKGDEINWDFIETAFASVCCIALIPMQDVLALGSKARMNLPARESGNWGWRFQWEKPVIQSAAKRLRELVAMYDRGHHAGYPKS